MTDTATKPVTERAYIGNVTLSIGMVSTLGNLFTVTRTNAGKEEAFKTVCPECASPTEFLSQKYVCNENAKHGPFVLDEVRYGRMDGDKLVVTDTQKVKDARTSVLPEKALELQVHLREEVAGRTFPKGNVYVFRPTGKSPFYGILVDLLQKRPDIILLAKTNMRKVDHLVQVDLEFGQLVVREMIWPADTKEFGPVEMTPASSKLVAQAEMLIDASIEPFDPAEYAKDSRARIAAVIEEASGSAPKGTSKKKAQKLEETDMAELLAQSIAAKKTTRKKAS